MGARTNSGSEFVQPQSAENVLVLGLILISGMAVLSTWVACFIPIRGELTNQPEGKSETMLYQQSWWYAKLQNREHTDLSFRRGQGVHKHICSELLLLQTV